MIRGISPPQPRSTRPSLHRGASQQTQIAERETEILRIAGDLLAARGLEALTMENVLERVDFSKGTLYNHFTCREDLLVAFHAKCFSDHLEFFARGALFRGRSRERFMAAGMGHEIKCRLDPQPFRFDLTEDILGAASARWRDAFFDLHRETMGIFVGIARDGIASGDLPARHTPEFVASTVWALCIGADALHEGGMIFRGVKEPDFAGIRQQMVLALEDGFAWQPLSRDHDYGAVRRRILAEVYAPEARQLGLLTEAAAPAVAVAVAAG
jgi:AcrR family transcriptional regulator